MHENPRYQTRQTLDQTCREIFYRMTRCMSIYVLVRVDVAKRGMRTEERK